MKIINLRQILVLHELMIRKYGGSSGIRDMGMLKFGGEDLYPDIYMKAGALVQSIVKNHPFLDGNKRTAFSSAFIFFKGNGILLLSTRKKVVSFMVKVANENLSVDEISSWLRKNSKKTNK